MHQKGHHEMAVLPALLLRKPHTARAAGDKHAHCASDRHGKALAISYAGYKLRGSRQSQRGGRASAEASFPPASDGDTRWAAASTHARVDSTITAERNPALSRQTAAPSAGAFLERRTSQELPLPPAPQCCPSACREGLRVSDGRNSKCSTNNTGIISRSVVPKMANICTLQVGTWTETSESVSIIRKPHPSGPCF